MRRSPILLTLLLLSLGGVGGLAAQEEAPPVSLEELREMLLQQQDLLEKQDAELQRQSDLIVQQAENLTTHREVLQSMQTQLDQLAQTQGVEPDRDQEDIELMGRLASLERAVLEQPELPAANVLQTGEFPGSIRVPGTNLAAKVGGFVRLGLVSSHDPIGSDDRFIVASIPPAGQATAADQSRVTISAQRSRMNLDVRMDSSVGGFRAFLEGDFAGAGGTENYRLRHAYGQYNRILVGQTWSTLMDNSAVPEELDFEGLSAQINVRQPLIRWGDVQFVGRTFGIAIENPDPSISGGDGVSTFPDLTANTRWSGARGHLQLGAVLRAIRGEPVDEEGNRGKKDDTAGYGLSLSTRRIVGKNGINNFKWQLNLGRGMGRYINDLGSVGGQDAVFDPDDGTLRALPVLSSYIGYQHWWRPNKGHRWFENSRSTLVYSYVYVDNFDFQEDGAYKATQRTSANFIFSPISAIDLGLEMLWGARRNKDESLGTAFQWQMIATFRF